MTIKNLIFDLGGVILNIDFHLTINAFTQLGAAHFEQAYSFTQQKALFDQFETGKITAKDFRKIIKAEYDLKISDQDFDNAWNAMLLDLPKEKIEFIKNLNKYYKTYLLSNTNEIHLTKFQETHGKEIFKNCFNKEYYSFEIGQRKPDPEAFHIIINENNLIPEQTLFLDDSYQHVESAQKIGLQAKLITADLTMFDIVSILGKKII